MSEDTPGVNVQETAPQSSSPEQQTIPKYRLDEEIARNKLLQEQLQFQQQLLRQGTPAPVRQNQPEPVPTWLKQLKEENPAAFQAYVLQDRKLKEQSAATFQVMDQQDRLQFVQEFGQDAARRLPEIEQKLEELRQRNIHAYNRGQIFVHLEGVDAIQKRKTPSKPSVQQSAPAQSSAGDIDAPGSDVRSAGTVATGSATATKAPESLDELEKRLSEFEF